MKAVVTLIVEEFAHRISSFKIYFWGNDLFLEGCKWAGHRALMESLGYLTVTASPLIDRKWKFSK